MSEALWDFDHVCRLLPDDAYAVRVRAQLRIRLRAPDQARADIDRLRELGTAEASSLFLEALYEQATGNGTSFREKIAQAQLTLLSAFTDDDDYPVTTRLSLLKILLVAGDVDSADEQLRILLADGTARRKLHDDLLPDLNDLALILLEQRGVRALRDSLRDQLYPPSAPRPHEPTGPPPPTVDRQPVEHPPYPCPMYCKLTYIQGLEAEKSEADQILQRHGAGRTMALLTIKDGRHRVYGQWNFKQEPEDDYNFKFCDELETVLHDNLRTIVQSYRVQTVLFVEEELSDRFKEAASQQGLAARCLLVNENM